MSDSRPPLEVAMLLRVPQALAEHLKKQMAEKPTAASIHAKEDKTGGVRLTFTTESGEATVQAQHKELHTGQIVNLPSIIEIQKTFDHIHYYKVADVGQMLVVQAPVSAGATPSLNSNPVRPKGAAAANEQGNQPIPVDWPHGLTPPTRDIRAKRYERNSSVPRLVVNEIDTQLYNLEREKTVHTFELIEEDDVEIIESDEEEDDGEELDEEDEEMLDEDEGGYGDDRTASGAILRSGSGKRSPLAASPAIGTGPNLLRTGGTSDDTGQRLDSNMLLSANRMDTMSANRHTPAGGSSLLLASSSPSLHPGGTGGSGQGQTGLFLGSPAVAREPTGDISRKGMLASPMHVAPSDTDMLSLPSTTSAAAGGGAAAASSNKGGAISIDALENMFGPTTVAPLIPTQTLQAPDLFAAAAPFPIEPAAPSALSAVDQLRGELDELNGRVDKARQAVTDAKNAILKNQAQKRLDALLAEKSAMEAKIAAAS